VERGSRRGKVGGCCVIIVDLEMVKHLGDTPKRDGPMVKTHIP
jgi:hypothetical protein